MKHPGPTNMNVIRGGVAVGCLACTAAFYFSTVRPSLGDHERLAAQADLARQKAEELRSAEASCRDLERRAQAAEKSVESHPHKPVDASNLNDRLKRLSEQAVLADCHIDEVFSPPTAGVTGGADGVLIPITMRGVGRYPAWVTFLAKIHDVFPDLEVIRLTMNGSAEDAESKASVWIEFSWHAASDAAPKPVAAK